jgi:diaminopropionate ammonia-lyase
MKPVEWIINKRVGETRARTPLGFLTQEEAGKARGFHGGFPQYRETPLACLTSLSAELGVGGIYVKDESFRFGLNAFKVLGASYAMGRYLAIRLGRDISELPYELLVSEEVRERLGDITFSTATDGNHGRAVAWTALQLGQKAVVYMPKGSAKTRLENIRATGAEAYMLEINYDDTVRYARANAEKYGWVTVQDTAWEGYEEIPRWIMQGYTTMVSEALDQLNRMEVNKPTHVFLQAGVGSMAGAVQGYLVSVFGEDRPLTVIVEPNKADCIFRSAGAGDGLPRMVKGDLDTIMAGLACGEPNIMAWNILRDYSDVFVSCEDFVAAKGMRLLGNPLADDPRVVSGESGAVTAGLLSVLMKDRACRDLRNALKLNGNSSVLLFSTEGDTNPENYRSIVWDGKYPTRR